MNSLTWTAVQNAKTLSALLKKGRVTERERLSAIVPLDRSFEFSKTEGNRTFTVSGKVTRDADEQLRVDLNVQCEERFPQFRLPDGRPAVRERSYAPTAMLRAGEHSILSGGLKSRTEGERTEHFVTVVQTHWESVDD